MKDDGRILAHDPKTNHQVLRDSITFSRTNEGEQQQQSIRDFSTGIEHEDVGGGDSQDELGRDEDGDEDGGISVHDERVRASFG